jgi:ferredoxin
MNCINFAPSEGAFANTSYVKEIDKAEAIRLLREAEEAGLVHSVYNQQKGIYYICNCCPCCCGIMRGMMEFGHVHALARSDFCVAVDAEACTGCESCVERCHFGALAVPEDVCLVDPMRCMGCGLCVSECPVDALKLLRREAAEQVSPPLDHSAWRAERAASSGVSLQDLV